MYMYLGRAQEQSRYNDFFSITFFFIIIIITIYYCSQLHFYSQTFKFDFKTIKEYLKEKFKALKEKGL